MSTEIEDTHIVPRRSPPSLETFTFEAASSQVIDQGNSLMAKNAKRENRKFHTLEHPEGMQRKAERLADILGLSMEQKKRGSMAIAWHDTIINKDSPLADNIIGSIKRHRGSREGDQPAGINGNEAKSADVMEESMREVNVKAGKKIFSADDFRIQRLSIDATYPAVEGGSNFQGLPFNEYPYFKEIILENPQAANIFVQLEETGITKGILFYQPHMEIPLEAGEQIPLEVFAVAQADLGTAGMDGREAFFLEGDLEYQELHENINPENLKRLLEDTQEQDEVDRRKVLEDMIKWLYSQPSFAAFQYLRSLKMVGLMEKNAQINNDQVVKLKEATTGKSHDSISAAIERAKSIEGKVKSLIKPGDSRDALAYIAKEMHYSL